MATRYILCIGAHPDDNEFSVGGTAARFRADGHQVRFVSVTNGDRGHYEERYQRDRSALAARRQIEAQRAAGVIGADYRSLGLHDGEVYVTPANTEAMVRCIRSFGPEGTGPDLVLFNRPVDYHRDHRYAAQLVLDATYMLTVPLMCPESRHLDRMPVFAYWFDDFAEAARFRADVVVPIDNVVDLKIDMACAHGSQVFEWLPYNMGTLADVPPVEDAAGRREMVARNIRARGEYRRRTVDEPLRRLLGPIDCRYVEAFQICEYGRVPDAGELASLFPTSWPL
ncbi:MAG TPA: PIG-L family deacetylase [Chthonomonadales bacterium]|nr:PIG-L family deacetylase [Chthonomonadales bacterium]